MLLPETSSPDRSRHRVRRALRALSTILIVSGAMLLLDAGLTLVWQEPISALYAKFQQRELAGRLGNLENLTELQLRALQRVRGERRRVAFLARVLRRKSKPGDPIGRIKIARTGTNFVVVEGTDPGDLRKGPGHYSDTSVPGLPGRWRSPAIAPPTWRRSATWTGSAPATGSDWRCPTRASRTASSPSTSSRRRPTAS
jgi:sortase A